MRTPIKIQHWGSLIVSVVVVTSIFGQESCRLEERFLPGYEYTVTSQLSLLGELTVPLDKGKSERVKISGSSRIEYAERIRPPEEMTSAPKVLRSYKFIEFERTVGDDHRKMTLRPEVRRVVVLKGQRSKVIFSTDGPLTWGEMDMIRTDLLLPSLAGLLPGSDATVGKTWDASDTAVSELTDMEVTKGKLHLRLDAITDRNALFNGRGIAEISFAGKLDGVNEDGPTSQDLSGKLYFDVKDRYICYLSLKGVQFLLDEKGKAPGRIEGTFTLKREAPTRHPDLSNEAIEKLKLDPTEENTMLLFLDPEFGVKFIHPRRWRVSRVSNGLITMDEVHGNGLLLTISPKPIATEKFVAEAKESLLKLKADLRQIGNTHHLGKEDELDFFSIEADIGKERKMMDYYIIRQPNGGATIAAALLASGKLEPRKEVEAIARSLEITRPLKDK